MYTYILCTILGDRYTYSASKTYRSYEEMLDHLNLILRNHKDRVPTQLSNMETEGVETYMFVKHDFEYSLECHMFVDFVKYMESGYEDPIVEKYMMNYVVH